MNGTTAMKCGRCSYRSWYHAGAIEVENTSYRSGLPQDTKRVGGDFETLVGLNNMCDPERTSCYVADCIANDSRDDFLHMHEGRRPVVEVRRSLD